MSRGVVRLVELYDSAEEEEYDSFMTDEEFENDNENEEGEEEEEELLDLERLHHMENQSLQRTISLLDDEITRKEMNMIETLAGSVCSDAEYFEDEFDEEMDEDEEAQMNWYLASVYESEEEDEVFDCYLEEHPHDSFRMSKFSSQNPSEHLLSEDETALRQRARVSEQRVPEEQQSGNSENVSNEPDASVLTPNASDLSQSSGGQRKAERQTPSTKESGSEKVGADEDASSSSQVVPATRCGSSVDCVSNGKPEVVDDLVKVKDTLDAISNAVSFVTPVKMKQGVEKCSEKEADIDLSKKTKKACLTRSSSTTRKRPSFAQRSNAQSPSHLRSAAVAENSASPSCKRRKSV